MQFPNSIAIGILIKKRSTKTLYQIDTCYYIKWAEKLLKDQRAGRCSPASKTSKGLTELTPLSGISNFLMYKAPPNGRWYLQCHANICMKVTQPTGHQILAQTIDSTETAQSHPPVTLNQHSKVFLLSSKIALTPAQSNPNTYY